MRRRDSQLPKEESDAFGFFMRLILSWIERGFCFYEKSKKHLEDRVDNDGERSGSHLFVRFPVLRF
jgi:hypothetical protein